MSEVSCRKKIQRIHRKVIKLLSRLEEYLNNHEHSGDQTQLKLVEAPKQQGKTICNHTKSVGRSKGPRHENDMHDSVIVTDTGFPYKILAQDRKLSSPERTIVGLSPDRTTVSPGWKTAPQKSTIVALDRTKQSPEQQIVSEDTCRKTSPPDKKIASTDGNISLPDRDMQTPDLNYLSPDRKTSQPDKITSSASKIQAINANNVLPDKKMLYPHVKMEKLDIVQLKLADDEHTPHITGCVLMPSTDIVVCDFYNRKVKLFDQSRKITDSIRLPWAPRDLSLVDDETVTVTIPSIRRIQYVKVFPKMKAFCGIQLDQCLERQKTIAFSNESNCTCHQTGIV